MLSVLLGLLALVGTVSLATGAVPLEAGRVLQVLARGRAAALAEPALARDALIVFDIRLPRTLLGIAVGATLALAGAMLQGLFRNPLADPALVGVSSGATVGAALVIVLGHRLLGATPLPFEILPVASFAGALAATLILYLVATRRGRTSMETMLLSGIALAALAGAVTGFLAFSSDDRQLRDFTFWSLGSLGGSTWAKLAAVSPMLVLACLALPFLGRGLNGLVLGEAEAFHLGIPVQRVKRIVVACVALAVGAAVSTSGLIGFIGLMVPHAVRVAVGPDHRLLLPAAALGGAALLVAADIVARSAVAPAELPIGIVTALLGAPYLLWLLGRRGRDFGA